MKAVFLGGPSSGQLRDVDDSLPSLFGAPAEGGVYERTGEKEDDRPVYRWRQLTVDQAEALGRQSSGSPDTPDSPSAG